MTNRHKLIGRKALALVCICLLALTGSAVDPSSRIRRVVDEAVRPLMVEYDLLGMTVAVTLNGRPSVFNYGVASREKNIPVDQTTRFEPGSISKIFTATLAAYASLMTSR